MEYLDNQKKLVPDNISLSPTFYIDRFSGMLGKYGYKAVLEHGVFKKAREMQVTALFALGLSLLDGREYWIYPEYMADTPDTYIFHLSDHEKIKDGKVRNVLNIEITEWEHHAKDGLLETIIKKLKDKKYPHYYGLLMYIKHPGEIADLPRVHQELGEIDLGGVGQVYVLSSVEGERPDSHLIAQLYPESTQIVFSLSEAREKYKTFADLIKIDLPRGRGEPYVIQEDCVLPLPDISGLPTV